MKKLIVLLAIIAMLLGACGDGLDYSRGKDSKAAFGNGNYQIMRGHRNGEDINILYNCKHKQEVMSNVENYVEKEKYVFFVGRFHRQKVFCKLNIETNLLSYYAEENGDEYIDIEFDSEIEDKQIELLSSLDDFSEEDRLEFERLTNN